MNDPAPAASDPPKAGAGLTRQEILSALGALGAVITLVTALLFYFGWRRSDVQAREMSIDVSLFSFSSQDYVLRSISSLYLPLLVTCGLGLASLWLNARLATLANSDRLRAEHRRRISAWALQSAVGFALLSAACIVFTAAAGVRRPLPGVAWLARSIGEDQWAVPLVLLLATTTAAYLWWIRQRLEQLTPDDGKTLHPPLLAAVFVAGTVALGSFWLLEEYASAVGRGQAQQLADGVDGLARTVVLSPTPLGIHALGVREERLGDPASPDVRYRTTGLRLLSRSGGKVLLVHDGWTLRSGTVIVLSDSDTLAWEFSH